ncbi:PREDICTED: nucleolin 2-like [Camelina sativa]|uniref:Nucleolin 2-like n=1 Tax=Camelina sativa TaxID=90675 RepID=A0ABM0V8M7_CAMSA|nr:PREDICTED: nucleolin 2-like [Camelina sativa]
MDESVDKGMKSLSLNGSSDAAIPNSRGIGRIFASGYDTALTRDVVESALRKHFASCGEITDVYIPVNYHEDNRIWKCAFIYFVGEGAVDKALKLNGSDVDGWNVSVTAYPFPENANSSGDVKVEGYDPSLSRDEILSAMTKLFSSYGEISPIIFSDRSIAY